MPASVASIAMTTYNGAHHVAEQLASLAAQTRLPSELVICDDGSSDATLDVLRHFAASAPFPVRIHRNDTNLGYTRNFIRAASLCEGELIFFCDQDDIWSETKIERVCDHFRNTSDLAVSHDHGITFEGDRPDISSYDDFLSASGYRRAINVKGCTLAFRTSLIDRAGWPRPHWKWSHDEWISLTSILLGARGFMPEALIQYRVHGKNTSSWLPGGRDRIRKWLRDIHLPPFTSRADLDSYISMFVWPKNIQDYLELIAQLAPVLTPDQADNARRALAHRQAILEFLATSPQKTPGRRVLGACDMFLKSYYRRGDGLLGFFQDIAGNRPLPAWALE